MTFYALPKPVPNALHASEFVLRPLCALDVELDFEAYSSSPQTVQQHSAGKWKTVGFTLQEDLELLRQHELRHQAREDFAFLLASKTQHKSLGCVYLLPLLTHHERAAEYGYGEGAAMVTFWTRDDADEPGFSSTLVAALKAWLLDYWQFSGFVFRINEHESVSKRALELNGFKKVFATHAARPRMLFYSE